MVNPRLYRPPIMAALAALVCALAIASAPAPAHAEVKTYSPDNQLSLDVYSSLGLTTTGLDEEAATENAPYDAHEEGSTTTLLTMDDVYVAANGQRSNTYTLRSRLNRLDDSERDTVIQDDYGIMVGAYKFYDTSDRRDYRNFAYEDGYRTDGALSDNSHDVVKTSTYNGFDGKYATSVACDLGNGWDDHVAELRANSDTNTFSIKIFALDASGNRSEVDSLYPTFNRSQVSMSMVKFNIAGYQQERDAAFEIEAADVDNDNVDEIFCYTGAYEDRDSTRFAIVDMFDYNAQTKSWSHSTTELDGSSSYNYATDAELQAYAERKDDDNWTRQLLKQSPVVTLAAGDLDRHDGEEIAMAISAPGSHDNGGRVGKCYIYTWDTESKSLMGIDGLNEEVGGAYVPLYNTNSAGPVAAYQGMASANCAFGTFQVPSSSGTPQTTMGLIIAGWDRTGSTDISKDDHYTQAAYRYVYYDPARDSFVVSDYLTKALGKDAEHIVYTATHDSNKDERYVPTLAPFALCCARLQGLHQSVENDAVLFGGEVYNFVLGTGLTDSLGSISLCSNQQNDNSNTKTKEQVWIGDVVAGNVSGSEDYEESFLAVIGIHRDADLGDDDDYYWMDIAHFTAKWHGQDSIEYKTAQEGVIRESNRINKERFGVWVSLCLPNVSHRGMQVRYKDMAKYYTAPTVLAMLEDAPYFGDLQQSFRYIKSGSTGFNKTDSSTDGTSWSINAQVGAYIKGAVAFFAKGEYMGQLQGTFSYAGQRSSTLQYGVSYASHASAGNKVVVYTIPMVYYYYEVSDPTDPNGEWSTLMVPTYLEPVTALVSQDVWDEKADELGLPKVSDVLSNTPGNPESYTAAAM